MTNKNKDEKRRRRRRRLNAWSCSKMIEVLREFNKIFIWRLWNGHRIERRKRNSQEEEEEEEEITHHKLGKSCISKEQSPNVVRSKSRMASTSKSNVEVGRGLGGGGGGGADGGADNSKSIDDEPWIWLKRKLFDDDDDGDGIAGGVERIFRRSSTFFDLFIWCRIIATTIRRNRGLERSIVFNFLLNFDEIIWSIS